MNAQEIFDKVATHLLKQNARSTDTHHSGEYTCLYRSNNGMKCAVGCLVEDDEYAPWMEGMSVGDLLDWEDTPGSLVHRFLPHRQMLAELQRCHDNYPPNKWRASLQDIARCYGLKWNHG